MDYNIQELVKENTRLLYENNQYMRCLFDCEKRIMDLEKVMGMQQQIIEKLDEIVKANTGRIETLEKLIETMKH